MGELHRPRVRRACGVLLRGNTRKMEEDSVSFCTSEAVRLHMTLMNPAGSLGRQGLGLLAALERGAQQQHCTISREAIFFALHGASTCGVHPFGRPTQITLAPRITHTPAAHAHTPPPYPPPLPPGTHSQTPHPVPGSAPGALHVLVRTPVPRPPRRNPCLWSARAFCKEQVGGCTTWRRNAWADGCVPDLVKVKERRGGGTMCVQA